MAATKLRNTVLFNNANLKALYEFESGALTTDSSGNSRTLTNTDVTETTGVYGGGGAFNGTSSKLQLPTPSDLGSITGLTYSVWINAFNKDYGANDGKIIDIRGATHYAILTATSTKFQFIINSGSATTIETNEITGAWTHLVGTYDGATMRLFVNGSQVASSAKTGTLTINATGMIGQEHNNGAARYFQGSMDDVAIFSSALSADQIKELYEGRFIGESWPQSGLVGGWHLNGNSTDFSGNGNTLTNIGAFSGYINAGKFGQCADVSGALSDGLAGFHNSGIGKTNFTFSIWAKTDSNNQYGILWYIGNTGGSGFGLVQSNVSGGGSGNYIQVLYGGVTWHATNTQWINTTSWHHIVMSRDTTTMTLYVNGNPVYTSTATPNDFGGESGLGGKNGIYFNGKLDEFLIFNRVLTPQEIRRMYALGTGKL